MNQQRVVMNFSVPPSLEDIEAIAGDILESLPEEILEFCDGLALQIEEMPDETTQKDLDLEDPYEIVALFHSGKELSPGVESKVANDEDVLILYRRPLLDVWGETGEDLAQVVREAMIEELGNNFDFSEDEIEEMTRRHYQGML
ncbi:MAG: metallopeptidase family protein [Rhodospirillales bacterium]|nr:metallopeptidase family protein [Alphaproteobacteria bacterium]USO03587.1 MAG: metallopeptidase family protein [Rhodospirillales bacterium]